jgi:hypothetical protein
MARAQAAKGWLCTYLALTTGVLVFALSGSATAATTIDCGATPGALETELEDNNGSGTYEIDGTCTAPKDGVLDMVQTDLKLRDADLNGLINPGQIRINQSNVEMKDLDIGSNVSIIRITDNSYWLFETATIGGPGDGASNEITSSSTATFLNATIYPATKSPSCQAAVCVSQNAHANLTNTVVRGALDNLGDFGSPVHASRGSSITIRGSTEVTNSGTAPSLGIFQHSNLTVVNGSPEIKDGTIVGPNSFAMLRHGTYSDTQSWPAIFALGSSVVKIPNDASNVTINGGNGTRPEAILAKENTDLNLLAGNDLTITAGEVVCNDSSRITNQNFSSSAGVDCNNLAVSDGRDGKVGIGTRQPSNALHVRRDGGGSSVAPLKLQNPNGKLRFVLASSGTGWSFDNAKGTSFDISKIGSGSAELSVFGGGDVTIGGTLTEKSSRESKAYIEAVEPSAVLARLNELKLSRWSYKDSPGRHLGPMAGDFHNLFGLGRDAEHIAPKDLAGVAMASAKALDARTRRTTQALRSDLEAKAEQINKQQRLIAKQRQELARLRARIASQSEANGQLRKRVDKLAALLDELTSKVETRSESLAKGQR